MGKGGCNASFAFPGVGAYWECLIPPPLLRLHLPAGERAASSSLLGWDLSASETRTRDLMFCSSGPSPCSVLQAGSSSHSAPISFIRSLSHTRSSVCPPPNSQGHMSSSPPSHGSPFPCPAQLASLERGMGKSCWIGLGSPSLQVLYFRMSD